MPSHKMTRGANSHKARVSCIVVVGDGIDREVGREMGLMGKVMEGLDGENEGRGSIG